MRVGVGGGQQGPDCAPLRGALEGSGLLVRWHSGEESAGQRKRPGFDPWVRKIPWSRKWQSILVFLPGKSRGERSLVGCSPRGCKESDMTEQLSVHAWRSILGSSRGEAQFMLHFVRILLADLQRRDCWGQE